MLLFLTLLCIWLGVKVNQARRQKEAIAALRSIDAAIRFHHQLDEEGKEELTSEPPGPAWLRQITGDEYFQRVHTVSASSVAFTDEYAAYLSAFKDLAKLHIWSIEATDEVLAQIGDTDDLEEVEVIDCAVGDLFIARLAHSKRLKTLTLDTTRVTARGLKALEGLRQVRSLKINNSPIGNDGLIGLRSMTNLEYLYIAELPIDDRGLDNLPDLFRLNNLELCRLNVTDAGLAKIKTGPTLTALDLSGTKIRGDALSQFCTPNLRMLLLVDTPIDNDGLRHLEKATRLDDLALDGTAITDEGLAHLTKIPSLSCLELRRTKITASGLRYLEKLPNICMLALSDTNLSSDAFEHLTRLRPPGHGDGFYLDLIGTPLDDSTIDYIAQLPVAQLLIGRTKITDAGLAKLTNMTVLSEIDLTDTAVTPAAVEALKKRIPSLHTVHTSFDLK
jgi:hypothetical protein